MKNSILVISILLLIGCGSKQIKINVKDGIQTNNATIITFDSLGRLEKYQGTVVIDANKIVYVGPQEPIVKGNYRKINTSGKYIIPGLIDSHVHLANVAGMNFRQKRKFPELVKLYFEQLPKSFLYFGYTTLIDVNNYAPEIINKIKLAPIRPDIFSCGKQIMVMNDFMMEMEEYTQEQRYNFAFLYDHYNKNVRIPDSIELKYHTTQALIQNIIEEQNGICVKTLYEDASSGMNVSWEKPSLEILKDLVKESKQAGIPTIIHSPSFEGQKIGFEAGVDIIAHAMWNWSENPDSILDTEISKEQYQLLINFCKNQTGYQPTYRAIFGEIDILNESILTDKILEEVYPESYLNWLKSVEGTRLKNRILNRPNYIKKTNPAFFEVVRSKFSSDTIMMESIYKVLKKRIINTTKFLADNKANLLLGTDFGVMNMHSVAPGYCGFQEMLHWYESGIDLTTILKAATFNNAKAFNLNSILGTVEEGKIANLLLLNADPLKDIDAYNKIDMIVIHGKPISRQDLSAR